MKLTIDDKIEIYNKKKEDRTAKSLSSEYSVRPSYIHYLVRLIDVHGFSILRTYKNKAFSKGFKENAIQRVLINGESTRQVSIELGLTSNGLLYNWIRDYKKNGYNVIERPKGRTSMTKKTKKIISNKKLTTEEKLKQLEKENLYLRAENEYLKKLDVVVQKRKNREQGKK